MPPEDDDAGRLGRIVVPEGPADLTDDAVREAADFERRARDLELHRLEQELRHREEYAARIFRLIVGWLVVMLAIVLLDGLRGIHGFGDARFLKLHFNLSDTVILGLIGGTTVNVLGILSSSGTCSLGATKEATSVGS